MIKADYSTNNKFYSQPEIGFQANGNVSEKLSAVSNTINKPINVLSNTIENSVNDIVGAVDEENKKASHKIAIAVGSGVVILSLGLLLLNPRFSSKMTQRLKNLQQSIKNKFNNTEGKGFKGHFYKIAINFLNYTNKGMSAYCNLRSARDLWLQRVCTAEKSHNGIKNNFIRETLTKIRKFNVKIFEKPHKATTRGFDAISKLTVRNSYSKALKKMSSLEEVINQYKGKFPNDVQTQIEAKLRQIADIKRDFAEESVNLRLSQQEELMQNLERDVIEKINTFSSEMKKSGNKKEVLKSGMKFWAEEILKSTKESVTKDGTSRVASLFGNNEGEVGLYNEILNLCKSHLSSEEANVLSKKIAKANKALRKANNNECIEYFDKKRDLMMGGAPTDVITTGVLLGAAGLSIGTADDRETRISRLVRSGVPALLGLGTSLCMTAALVSGPAAILIGAATAFVFSKVGSIVDEKVLGHKILSKKRTKVTNEQSKMEVKNV